MGAEYEITRGERDELVKDGILTLDEARSIARDFNRRYGRVYRIWRNVGDRTHFVEVID